jgi:hypothetical protein
MAIMYPKDLSKFDKTIFRINRAITAIFIMMGIFILFNVG